MGRGSSPTDKWNHDRLDECQRSSKFSLRWLPGRAYSPGETGTPLSLGTWCEVGTRHSTHCVSVGKRCTLLCVTAPQQKEGKK